MTSLLDRWLSPSIRKLIEDRYYAKIVRQANFELLSRDPEFLEQLDNHVGLFADHGIVHARDVATRILDILQTIHDARLIPPRSRPRFESMQGLGVLLAYIHDIGMIDFSAAGRAVHPEFAAQAMFDPANDNLIDQIWSENSANLSWRLSTLASQGLVKQAPKTVLRELLSMAMAHSKSKATAAALNEPSRLRSLLQEALCTDLYTLWQQQVARRTGSTPPMRTISADAPSLSTKATGARRSNDLPLPSQANGAWQFHAARFYQDFQRDAYAWLKAPGGPLAELAQDAIDTVRALRCADALRQRGAVFRTSAGYEIYVDGRTANAVFALRLGSDRLYLLEVPGQISAGEANMASSELDPSGDLRVTFHRGAFAGSEEVRYAAESAALIVLDLAADVLDSLIRAPGDEAPHRAEDLSILLEEVNDNLAFADLVRSEVAVRSRAVGARVHIVPSLAEATARERALYLAAEPVEWSLEARRQLLAHMGAAGHAVEGIDPSVAFQHVKLAHLERNNLLIEAETKAGFVYIPLGAGLCILPLGGYDSVQVPPWMPLGVTGVIRGAARNATVVAEHPVRLLMVPRSVYMKHWHRTLNPAEFCRVLERDLAASSLAELTSLERMFWLERAPLFAGLSLDLLLAVAEQSSQITLQAGSTLYQEGSIGDGLYLVISGEILMSSGAMLSRRVGPGDVLGEIEAFNPGPRQQTAIAAADATLLELDNAAIMGLFDHHGEFARRAVEVLALHARERQNEIAALRMTFAEQTSAQEK